MEANPFQNDRLSIKNLLFTKAIPNYTLPVPTDGHLTFACTDCGDRFIIKSSFDYHISRKSLKITYFCRHCSTEKIFFNRCDLLSHIRSHAFKTATISITDIKIEPLPLSFYKYQSLINTESEAFVSPCVINIDDTDVHIQKKIIACYDCKTNIYLSGTVHSDRAKHYTQYTNKLYSCPICLLTVSTECALKAHLRIHLKEPPYYCPDCGMLLTKKAIIYPYSHDCDSFRMMRVTTKLKCLVNNCNKVFHPTENIKHLRLYHLKNVYKCPICSVACYKLENMQKHFKLFHVGKVKQYELKKLKHVDFLQCEMCPGRLVIPGQIERHLTSHENSDVNTVYPCWTCGAVLKSPQMLLEHQKYIHPDSYMEKMFGTVSQDSNEVQKKKSSRTTNTGLLRASERCHKCSKMMVSNASTSNNVCDTCKCTSEAAQKIVCHLCQVTIALDWELIKNHYGIYHKEHVCLDLKILVKKVNINAHKKENNILKKRKKVNCKEKNRCDISNSHVASENISSTSNSMSIDDNTFTCRKCGHDYESKQSLENHIVEHRDPFMAYQCMECGDSFIAKPSFSTHLLVKHGVNDVNNYIKQKNCYTEDSVNLQKPINVYVNQPVNENQCNICREQFCDSTEFEKHFRVHGMAFLMKNTNKPISPEKP